MKNTNLTKTCGIAAVLFLCILLLVCSAPLRAQKSLSVQEWFTKGRTALYAKRYDEAIDAFTKVIEQRNKAATTPRLLRAHAYASKSLFGAAVIDLDSLISWYKEDPQSVSTEDIERAYFLRGEVSSSIRGDSAAIRDFDTVIQLAPQNTRAYFKRGTLRTNIRDIKGAIDDFTFYISQEKNKAKYKSDIALSFFARGVLYTALLNSHAALGDFNSAIDLGIDSVSIYFRRALVKASLQDTIGAIKDMSTYISHEQKNATKGKEVVSSLVLRGLLYFLIKDYNNVLIDLKKALAMPTVFKPKGLYSLHLLMGSILELQERNEEAIAEYTYAILASADACEARLNRGVLYLELEKMSDAKADFSYAIDILEKKRDSLSVSSLAMLGMTYYNRALVLESEGKLLLSLQDLDKAVLLVTPFSDTTTNVDIWETMGKVLESGGELSPSLQDMDKAAMLITSFSDEITSADVWKIIGDIKVDLKEYSGALTAYDKAAVQRPEQPAMFYYNRALAYTGVGDSLSAITSVTKAAHMQPDNADFYSLRGGLKFALEQYAEALQDYTLAIRHDAGNAVHYFDRARVALKLNDIQMLCEDIKKARQLGLPAAQSLYEDMMKEGVCE